MKTWILMCIFSATLVLGGPPLQAQQPLRTWTSKSGKTEQARLVSDDGRVVALKLRAGRTIKIKRSSLSAEDHLYLETASGRAAGGGTSSVGSGDWPGWRGPNRDGKSPDTGLLKEWPAEGPKRLWHKTGLGKGFSTVSVAGGLVYATGSVNDRLKLFAFDLEGTKKWDAEVGPAWTGSYPGTRAAPTIEGDRIYLLSGPGVLYCLDTRSGRSVWNTDLAEFGGKPGGWGFAESALVTKEAVIVCPGRDYSMVALDKSSGKAKWKSKGNRGSAQYGSTILAVHQGSKLLINGNSKGIYAVNPANGDLLWENGFCEGNTANCPTPAYSEGFVFWSNGYGKGGLCLELGTRGASAKEAWRTNDLVNHHGGYIIHEGHIYGNHNQGWTCLDLKTGERKWFERGVGKGSVVYADGMLYTFGESGGKMGLVECSPDGFASRGSFSVSGKGPSWAHPVVIGGRLYLRYDDNLYCYDVKAP